MEHVETLNIMQLNATTALTNTKWSLGVAFIAALLPWIALHLINWEVSEYSRDFPKIV